MDAASFKRGLPGMGKPLQVASTMPSPTASKLLLVAISKILKSLTFMPRALISARLTCWVAVDGTLIFSFLPLRSWKVLIPESARTVQWNVAVVTGNIRRSGANISFALGSFANLPSPR